MIPGKFRCGESGIFTFHFVCHHWGYDLHRIGNIRSGSLGPAFTSGWFFLSIVFPTLTAAVSDLHIENMASILGLLFTFAGVGGMLGPWLIGLVGDALGLSLEFGINLFYCGLLLVIMLVLIKETKHDRKDT